MQEPEAETSTDPEPRCRLCLQWTDGADNTDCGLRNIFTEDDDSLGVKIRDCLGVFASPEDSIQTICTNCRQTVSLIDEFRTLCRQTEEIYESVRIRCKDSERSERYGEYVGELRKLVQEHKDTINELLVGIESVEGTADEDSISQHFVPMSVVKEEPEENDEDCGDEPMAMESVEIKPDRPSPTDESDDDVDQTNEGERSKGISSTSYEHQVKLAQEVLKRLRLFTSNMMTDKQFWTEVAAQMNMEYKATRTRWNRMKKVYLSGKAGSATGSRNMIDRLKGCALFNLMNRIVPELDKSVEPWVAPESVDIGECERKHGNKSSYPMDLKIAIAEEIKKSPELWDRSLVSSTHVMDQAWKNIAKKFEMDPTSVRLHWRTLQDLYRTFKKRLALGARDRTKTDAQFKKLIDIMHYIYQTNEGEVVKQEEAAEQGSVEEETEENLLVVLKEQQVDEDAEDNVKPEVDTPVPSQKLVLAEIVYKHEHLWNQKHPDFNNAVARDQKWDHIADTLNTTRKEAKYAFKGLRTVYRKRVERLKQGLLRPDARILNDPLFKQLELIFGPAPPPPPPAEVSADEADESESEESPQAHGDGATNESQADMNMKVVALVEKQEIIWDSKHPNHTNRKKLGAAWDSIARKMKLTRAQTKAMWMRQKNVYRTRRTRLWKGIITEDSHLLREPLYLKLHSLLKDHMQVGKSSGMISESESSDNRQGKQVEAVLVQPMPEQPRKRARKGSVGPFRTMEDKVRLVKEVIKHEFLWNATHPDYFKSDLRGATWSQIAGMFDYCSDGWVARNAWRRLRNMHRPRESRTVSLYQPSNGNEEDEATSSNPLFELFSKMAESLTGENEGDPEDEGESSRKLKKRRIQEITETYMTHKRRFTGKRNFADEGCIKVIKAGIARYEKICELCGKQIERSLFEYHMNQHNGLKPYVCSIEGCGRQYSNKITRDRHEIVVHSDDGYKFECDQCDEKFKYRSAFDYHYAIKHESQQLPCTICGKLLKHKVLLREHLRRHKKALENR